MSKRNEINIGTRLQRKKCKSASQQWLEINISRHILEMNLSFNKCFYQETFLKIFRITIKLIIK